MTFSKNLYQCQKNNINIIRTIFVKLLLHCVMLVMNSKLDEIVDHNDSLLAQEWRIWSLMLNIWNTRLYVKVFGVGLFTDWISVGDKMVKVYILFENACSIRWPAMLVTNITHNTCHNTGVPGVSAIIWHIPHLTTIIHPISAFVCSRSAVCVSTVTRRNWCNHRHQCVQPSAVLKIKIVQPLSWPYFSFAIITLYKNQITPV